MKIAAAIGTSIATSMLGLLLGTTTFAYAQHGNEDERQADSEKHKQKEHQKEHKKENRKEHGRSTAQQHSDTHQANGPEHGREANRHEPEQHSRSRDVWQGHRAQHWEREHHTWRERGGYRGYRIPEDRFREHFGRGHWFRVRSVPIIVVEGYPRFQYGGFWFTLVDPWPEYWSRTWYETDDVYIDYVNDGYYMYNRRHPGVAIAVNVSF
jgi:hypothetical protein